MSLLKKSLVQLELNNYIVIKTTDLTNNYRPGILGTVMGIVEAKTAASAITQAIKNDMGGYHNIMLVRMPNDV